MKNTADQITELKEDLWTVVEALLEFGGERDADGEYVISPLQNTGIDESLSERLRTLAAAVSPLRGRLQRPS